MKKSLEIASALVPAAAVAVTPTADAHAQGHGGDAIRIADLRVSRAIASPGETVVVELSLVNESAGTLKNVKWSIVAGATQQSGTVTLEQGQERTVKVTIAAPAKTASLQAKVDATNASQEPDWARANNSVGGRLVVAEGVDGDTVQRIAKAVGLVEKELDREGRYLKVQKMTVQGSTATIHQIVQARPAKIAALGERVAVALGTSGLSKKDVQAFGAATDEAWVRWVKSYQGVLKNAFPEFAAYPGKTTPKVEGRPVVVGGSASAFSRSKVSEAAVAAGASPAAAAAFADALQARFEIFTQTARWVGLEANGTVPTFAPPYVPVGPVVAGDNIASPGHLMH